MMKGASPVLGEMKSGTPDSSHEGSMMLLMPLAVARSEVGMKPPGCACAMPASATAAASNVNTISSTGLTCMCGTFDARESHASKR